jgi:hypothetical protein
MMMALLYLLWLILFAPNKVSALVQGDFYIFTIITDGVYRILTLRMALTSLAFLFYASFIFTTFAYVARHGGVTR